MFANTKALLVIVSCALAVQAQTSTGSAPASQSSVPAGLDNCILGCVSAAAQENGCGSFTNLTCTCTSTAFAQATYQCLTQNCTPSDLATANALQQQECAPFTNSSSTTGSTPASTGGASTASSSTASASHATSGASTTSSSTTSATSSSAAMMLSAPFSLGGLVGTLVASAGALVGAAFIL